MNTQKIVLDSCVVIDLIEKQGLAGRLRAKLRGKPVSIILCDVVLREVQRVRGLEEADIMTRISKIFRRVTRLTTGNEQRTVADSITAQYSICHKGDNMILALCKTRNFVLLTFDRMLLTACGFAGVAAFHPTNAGGI